MRVYFVGAGASKQDGFPLTRELKQGVAWAICEDRARFNDLAAHLRHLYNVDDSMLRASASAWEALRLRPGVTAGGDAAAIVNALPDVTDWLSMLDWMIREQSSFGPGRDAGEPTKVSLLAQLTGVRDLVVQALCLSLGVYQDNLPPGSVAASTTTLFMDVVQPDDLLVTTNWDLLLDAARDQRFGTCNGDYGTGNTNVILQNARPKPQPTRPRLLKLHGSLSWRYCPRCQRLVIDPRNHVAGDRLIDPNCPCSYPFSELIVTPGFVREYRNVHLLTIWREALFALASADEWVFIGYSLPPDDVGIRALLLRARCIREDVQKDDAHKLPKVTVVSGRDGASVCSRFRSIAATSQLYPGDFAKYVAEQRALS
jgi:NAD-dependent SIR2 family protein deacetylase